MTDKIKAISLFSGAGGFDLGFESTGLFETILAVEFNKTYAETLIQNKGYNLNGIKFLENTDIIVDSIENINGNDIINKYKISKNDKVIVYGGPPCQSFSTMGKRLGLDDDRGKLIFEFARIIDEIKPDYFIFENVPNLAIQWKGKILKELLAIFNNIGYSFSNGILDAADYGSWTKRKRLIIFGSKSGITNNLPLPTHSKLPQPNLFNNESLKQWNKVGELFDNIPDPNTTMGKKLSHHIPVNHSDEVIERIMRLKPGEQDKVRKRWKLDPQLPANSLMAGGDGGYVLHMHSYFPRELTLRECASIQGFPLDYNFNGRPLDVAKQIVNAVPIQLAQALAKNILRIEKILPNS
jgi:DNA (cytosine-5)-methyltransferase 1